MGFTHHFTLHPLIWQIFSLISWLYFSTMWILWGRKCDYWVFHITHAKKGLPNHSSSTRDLKDFFSICDVENTILTYPPHTILSFLAKIGILRAIRESSLNNSCIRWLMNSNIKLVKTNLWSEILFLMLRKFKLPKMSWPNWELRKRRNLELWFVGSKLILANLS